MASFNSPQISSRIADDLPAIRKVQGDLARLRPDDGNTDYPNGTVRKIETANGYEFQQWNGSSWVTLEKWNINAQKVDGYSAATGTTASTIPVRDASGKLPGDISGNAATATKAAALSVVNPVEMGGTGASTAAEARSKLGVAPTSHASSATNYGIGTKSQYGHVKTHDDPDATLTAASGHALSPAGAAAMQNVIEGQLGDLVGVVSGQDSALRALIAQEVAKCLKLSGGTMTGELNLGHWIIKDANSLELVPFTGVDHGGYIDFHFNGSDADYTSRIIENDEGSLDIRAANGAKVNGNSILTIVASGSSGYDWFVKLSNGLIIQGGYKSFNKQISGDNEGFETISLNTPFSSNVYVALLNCNGTGVIPGGCQAYTTTSFTARAYGATGATRTWTGSDWIAFGY